MSGHDDGKRLNRRKFVQSATVGGLSLAAFPGLGSARGGEVETLGIGSLSLKDGLIENSQKYEIYTDISSDLRSKIEDRGEQIVTQIDMQKGISALNDAKRKGHVEFTEEDGVVQVGLTDVGRRAAKKAIEKMKGGVGTLHHGINDYEENPIAVPPNIKAWTDDPTTEAIVLGTMTAGMLVAVWGAGTGNVPATIAGIILGYSAGVISTINDGHGVLFTFNVTPIPPLPPVTPTVTAQ